MTTQAIQNEGKFILALLKELGMNRVSKSIKAQIVKILKSMSDCLENGEEVHFCIFFHKIYFYFWRKFEFLAKALIFGENLNFWRKLQFFAKFLISEQICNF